VQRFFQWLQQNLNSPQEEIKHLVVIALKEVCGLLLNSLFFFFSFSVFWIPKSFCGFFFPLSFAVHRTRW
jgi:hypothetical protein